MKIDQKVVDRLNELIKLGEQVLQTRYSRSGKGFVYFGDHGVDSGLSHQFGVSSLGLLEPIQIGC